MLFQQLHVGDDHAPVHSFAHVVDGEQGHLHGGEGFHFNAGLPVHFGGGGAHHTARGRQDFKLDRDPRQANRVTQGNQVAGFFGPLNARDAGDAQHIAFFGGAGGDQGQL